MRLTHRPLTVAGLLLALALGALEATVVSTAMPTVIGELGGIEHYSWVFTAYLVTSTVTVPIYGKLSDLYGRKPVMLLGIALFLAGSIASGAASSMGALVAFRALQGLGAGAMQPMALTIIGDVFELEERARMQGLFGSVWGVSGLVGPLAGGYIVKSLSWRWVFYVNIPFGLAAAALLFFAFHEKVDKKSHTLDVAGAATLTAAVIALLWGTRGGGSAALGLCAAAVLLGAFMAVERRAREPLLPLELFARRLIAVSSAAGALVGGAMFATITFVPLFVQGVLGGSPTQAGTSITPMVIGWPLASALSGRLAPRIGFRPLVRVGLLTTAVAAVALALLARPGASFWALRFATAGFGVGMGLANTALLLAVQTSVTWQQRGIATASTMFFRTIGGALAVGALGGALAAVLAGDPTVPVEAASRILGPARQAGLEPAVAALVTSALARGLETVFWLIFGLALAAFVASLAYPGEPPRRARAAAGHGSSAAGPQIDE